jgi:DnaK suppressor protein
MPEVKSQFEVIRNMPTSTRTPRRQFSVLEKQLASQRDELRMRIDRHHLDVVTDHELDDEAAAAVENISKDMLAATLERERRTLREIESALARMKKGEYGTCDGCGVAIPKARLDALPWAHLCVHCAERARNPQGLRMAV